MNCRTITLKCVYDFTIEEHAYNGSKQLIIAGENYRVRVPLEDWMLRWIACGIWKVIKSQERVVADLCASMTVRPED